MKKVKDWCNVLYIGLLATVRVWTTGFWADLKGPRAYKGLTVIVAAYFGMFAMVEARHERQINRASFERNVFLTMVSSGNRGAFVAAMKNFGPVQLVSAFVEPEINKPWNWWDKSYPNRESLLVWAANSLRLCTCEKCGESNDYRIDLKWAVLRQAHLRPAAVSRTRIDLSGSNLHMADLNGADLRSADLRYANLMAADLRGANLRFSDLRAAVFDSYTNQGPIFGTDLRGTMLQGSDLRKAQGLECNDIRKAVGWQEAYRDEGLACGAPIPRPRLDSEHLGSRSCASLTRH